MKSALRFPTILLAVLCLSSAFTGCDKDENEITLPTVLGEKSTEGMLYYYTNEAEGRIRVLDATEAFRKSYRLSADEGFAAELQLIAEENAEDYIIKIYPSFGHSPSYPEGKFIKPKMKEKNWLFPSNVISNLVGSNESRGWWDINMRSDKLYAFIFHDMGEIDGEDVYAIESMYAPGHYISHEGHPIQGTNMLTYFPYDDSEDAPRWRLFRPSGTYMEGNFEL